MTEEELGKIAFSTYYMALNPEYLHTFTQDLHDKRWEKLEDHKKKAWMEVVTEVVNTYFHEGGEE